MSEISSSSAQQREPGWGLKARAERSRQQAEAQRIIKSDINDPFTYKRPKQQAQSGNSSTTQPNNINSIPVRDTPPTVNAPNQINLNGPTIATNTNTNTTPPANTSDKTKSKTTPIKPSDSNPSTSASTLPTDSVSVSIDSTSTLIHSTTIELFEMLPAQRKSKGFGPKGIAIVKTIDNNYTMIVNNVQTRKNEFTIALEVEFDFIILPDRFATFNDSTTDRSWSIKFSSINELQTFARCVALCKDDYASFIYSLGGTRGAIKQDLIMGNIDAPQCELGDEAKVKYTIHTTSDTHPIGLGNCLISKETKKFTVGEGMINIFLENALCGMRKKGTRMMIVPAQLSEQIHDIFGPHLTTQATLCIEVTLTSHHIHANHSSMRQFHKKQDESNPETNSTATSNTANPTSDSTSGTSSASKMKVNTEEENAANEAQSQLSLKDRMKHLSLAGASAGSAFFAAASVVKAKSAEDTNSNPVTPASSTTNSNMANLTTNPTHTRRTSDRAGSRRNSDSLEVLFNELNLNDYLAKFRAEGLEYEDLIHLENDEIQTLVPQLGPRKRLLGRIAQMKANTADMNTGTNPIAQAAASLKPVQPKQTTSTPTITSSATTANTTQPAASSNVSSSKFNFNTAATTVKPIDSSPFLRSTPNPQITAPISVPSVDISGIESAAYERGKSEVLTMCREKIDSIKEQANNKFNELNTELEAVKAQSLADRAKAREVISQLKEEKEETLDKASAYASQVKSQAKEEAINFLKQALDSVYQNMNSTIAGKQLYEGAQVLEALKKTLKQVLTQQTSNYESNNNNNNSSISNKFSRK